MTENEAIDVINKAIEQSEQIIVDLTNVKDLVERADRVGEYYANLENCLKEVEACKEAIRALEENQKFHAIGTVEEFKVLKEKEEPKKPIRNDLCTCPSCGTYNETIKKRRITVAFDTVFCWHCGQAMKIKREE